MPRKISGVYHIIHVPSGRRYVGSAGDIYSRWSVHRWGLRASKHHCHYLQNAWNKYGETEFVFRIRIVCNIDELQLREQNEMDRWKGKLFNLQEFARSSRGYKHTKSARIAMSKAARLISSKPEERARRSERAKRQHAEGRIGKPTYKPRKPRHCRKCLQPFMPDRIPSGLVRQSKYCPGCRPEHKGGYYKYNRVLQGEGKPKQQYQGGKP